MSADRPILFTAATKRAAAADNWAVARPVDHVEVWVVPVAGLSREEAAAAALSLSADERERAARFRSPLHRDAYVARHAALRLLLARLLGVGPAALRIVSDLHGRPVLADDAHGLHFNLSHSGGIALIACSCLAPVGVDIEAVRDVPEAESVARDQFAPTEARFLADLPPERRRAGFFTLWTRKEAVVKALGLGLSHPLDGFCTGRPDRAPVLTRPGDDGAAWTLVDLDVGAGYAAAVAVPRRDVPIRMTRATWPGLCERDRTGHGKPSDPAGG